MVACIAENAFRFRMDTKMVLQPINKPSIYSSFSNISPESGNPAFILCHRSPAIMFDIVSSSQYIKNALPNDRAYAPAFKLPHHNIVLILHTILANFLYFFKENSSEGYVRHSKQKSGKLRHCIGTKEKTQWIFLYDSAIIYIDPRRA